ncbi:MAG: Gfo/Idh/MocA family oxidoreductase [Armatimonadetes bacterium]|nr:Gfo/Idh/MocA family oxidoreductase [Armatimonadota bacterium]
MVRIGIVDCDTSHVVQFTMRLNHKGIDEEQWVDGAKVVAAWWAPSAICPQETVDNYVKTLVEEHGIEMVAEPKDLIGKVDAVCIESVDGSVHLERAKPFLEAGLPLYIDKPFACSVSDSRQIIELAGKKNLPLFSTSSLRYALEVLDVQENTDKYGAVKGLDVFSPASLHPRNPGLFHYGIHGVEMLYALYGAGCEELWSVSTDDSDVVVGRWKDGRVGTMRGQRSGAHSYGFTACCEKQTTQCGVNTAYIYRELLKRMVRMFETGEAPLDINETLEIVSFIEAARISAANNGERQTLGS